MMKRTTEVVRLKELPLLGSNQDSPDPESDERAVAYRLTRGESDSARLETTVLAVESHDKSHDARHPLTPGVQPSCGGGIRA
jgi:hypothetical protein